eukprot:TRINITY_DN15236_c0_g1_i8.p1 TRINITY_DN15236_c0_g1~~TRINITY_DN15236_c0_g1_i8.p1  ORF type:complete len:332 (-),score=71.80 TRINITY_DN15236_c0_g1_i8:103-1098(-)
MNTPQDVFEVKLKPGTISVVVLKGNKLVTVYNKLKFGTPRPRKSKVFKKELPKAFLNTHLVLRLGSKRIRSLDVVGDPNPHWVAEKLELEIDEHDRNTLELQIRVNNNLDELLDQGKDVPDELGAVSLKLERWVSSTLVDNESSETIALSSPHVLQPGSVSIQVTYKKNLVLSPVAYEDFIQLLEVHDFFFPIAVIKHRARKDLMFLKCLMSIYYIKGNLLEFVKVMLKDHINGMTFSEDIFREDSPCSLVIELYLRKICQNYISITFKPFLGLLEEENLDCEIYPSMLEEEGKNKLKENLSNLVRYCEILVEIIFSSVDLVPEYGFVTVY